MSGVLFTRWNYSSRATSPRAAEPSLPAPLAAAPATSAAAPASVLELCFGYDNVAASQSNLQAWTLIPGSAAVAAQADEQMLYDGSIVGLTFRANTPKTAGTATFGAFVAGVSSALVCTWTTGQFRGSVTFGLGAYLFKAGDDVGPRLTTDSAFAPTTADVAVRLFVTYIPG